MPIGIREAESIQDEDRKKTLLDIAKLYNQTALSWRAAARWCRLLLYRSPSTG
jgi:hypothetical protein